MTYIPWPTGTTHTIDAFDQCEDFMTVLTTFINHMSPSPDAIEFVDIFSADGNYEVRYKSNVLIYPDGEVLWIPPAIYQVTPSIHLLYLPSTSSKTSIIIHKP